MAVRVSAEVRARILEDVSRMQEVLETSIGFALRALLSFVLFAVRDAHASLTNYPVMKLGFQPGETVHCLQHLPLAHIQHVCASATTMPTYQSYYGALIRANHYCVSPRDTLQNSGYSLIRSRAVAQAN